MTVRDKGIAAGAFVLAAMLLIPAVGQGAFPGFDDVTVGQEAQYPAGVTAEKIKMGEELYTSAGCAACHGPDAKGKAGMTADMTDGEWKFAEGGKFEALVAAIKDGLGADKTGGMPMPAATAREMTDAQIEALAAYTWSLNQKKD